MRVPGTAPPSSAWTGAASPSPAATRSGSWRPAPRRSAARPPFPFPGPPRLPRRRPRSDSRGAGVGRASPCRWCGVTAISCISVGVGQFGGRGLGVTNGTAVSLLAHRSIPRRQGRGRGLLGFCNPARWHTLCRLLTDWFVTYLSLISTSYGRVSGGGHRINLQLHQVRAGRAPQAEAEASEGMNRAQRRGAAMREELGLRG